MATLQLSNIFCVNHKHILFIQVLIIGGGDGGVLREVVKNPLVESVVLCEIDEVGMTTILASVQRATLITVCSLTATGKYLLIRLYIVCCVGCH